MNAAAVGFERRDSRETHPSDPTTEVSSKCEQIPIYAADGASLGFRTIEAEKRLIASGYVRTAYSRKGPLEGDLATARGRWHPHRDARPYKHSIQLSGEHRDWPLMEDRPTCRHRAQRGPTVREGAANDAQGEQFQP